jgi:hypothetical protein
MAMNVLSAPLASFRELVLVRGVVDPAATHGGREHVDALRQVVHLDGLVLVLAILRDRDERFVRLDGPDRFRPREEVLQAQRIGLRRLHPAGIALGDEEAHATALAPHFPDATGGLAVLLFGFLVVKLAGVAELVGDSAELGLDLVLGKIVGDSGPPDALIDARAGHGEAIPGDVFAADLLVDQFRQFLLPLAGIFGRRLGISAGGWLRGLLRRLLEVRPVDDSRHGKAGQEIVLLAPIQDPVEVVGFTRILCRALQDGRRQAGNVILVLEAATDVRHRGLAVHHRAHRLGVRVEDVEALGFAVAVLALVAVAREHLLGLVAVVAPALERARDLAHPPFGVLARGNHFRGLLLGDRGHVAHIRLLSVRRRARTWSKVGSAVLIRSGSLGLPFIHGRDMQA